MAIAVEHEKRKQEILDKALAIFVEEGYEDATFQKIADRCGITRTTLYIYFRNKREIFTWSIKQLTQNIEATLSLVIADQNIDTETKLRMVIDKILCVCQEKARLFTVVLNYLLAQQKAGKNPAEMVRRRILRLRHLLSTVLIEGLKRNQLTTTNVKAANEMLYALIESSIFRIAVLNQTSEELSIAIDLAINSLVKKEN